MRLDHIGIAVANAPAATDLITRLLGRPAYKTEDVGNQHVRTVFFEAGGDQAKLELVTPTGPESTLHKYLAKRGPGLHHLAFEVDDIHAEMARLAADGFELLQTEPTPGADNKLVCFLHPKSTNGVLVEICQSILPTPANEGARDGDYWTERYAAGNTGWDIGSPSTPIKEYLDQLSDKSLRILIPGAGNAHEAEYAWNSGFRNVTVLDIAPEPLAAFLKRVPDFPAEQAIRSDFFAHQGQYDLILEQTFFCSFPPTGENRKAYALKMHDLLATSGKLVGLWFDVPLTDELEKRPFGGTRSEYLGYFDPLFDVVTFTTAHNSIPPRAGRELFGILQKSLIG
ncbi:methylmalonyl-CoA epimerase [Neolewinella antarctica]|uniref:Methylmalonyl-CoA epimerase n=1 Tax=Neolewinella antarctica TaxID=442734 RepID=A0ABX0XF07_9BACT|nr:methylmalonyl-CoA epimerase [Neolewinella antarctica]NJC27464.1 methylmalonyl-CoA epimerase [Neolewinella antarctica]